MFDSPVPPGCPLISKAPNPAGLLIACLRWLELMLVEAAARLIEFCHDCEGGLLCLQVCRSAGYFEHARYVAHAANLPQVYLDILIEDCKAYDEALEYLDTLPRAECAAALHKYGKASSATSTIIPESDKRSPSFTTIYLYGCSH